MTERGSEENNKEAPLIVRAAEEDGFDYCGGSREGSGPIFKK